MFVGLSILVQQLRTERRVDIFTTTRKLRSQRHAMISSFVRYTDHIFLFLFNSLFFFVGTIRIFTQSYSQLRRTAWSAI